MIRTLLKATLRSLKRSANDRWVKISDYRFNRLSLQRVAHLIRLIRVRRKSWSHQSRSKLKRNLDHSHIMARIPGSQAAMILPRESYRARIIARARSLTAAMYIEYTLRVWRLILTRLLIIIREYRAYRRITRLASNGRTHRMQRRFARDLEDSPWTGSMEASIVRGLSPVGDDFILLILRAPQARRRRVRPRWRDLDIDIGHNRPTPEVPPTAMTVWRRRRRRRAWLSVPFPPPTLFWLLRSRGRPARDDARRRRGRRPPNHSWSRSCFARSIPPVCHFASSRRNIWPGRPEVSYWRNMARSREIFPLEAFSPPATYI